LKTMHTLSILNHEQPCTAHRERSFRLSTSHEYFR
jgi:hypothetical protein